MWTQNKSLVLLLAVAIAYSVGFYRGWQAGDEHAAETLICEKPDSTLIPHWKAKHATR